MAGATGVEEMMSAQTGKDSEMLAALEASRRLERSRRAALNRLLAEQRRHAAAKAALRLAEARLDDGSQAAQSTQTGART